MMHPVVVVNGISVNALQVSLNSGDQAITVYNQISSFAVIKNDLDVVVLAGSPTVSVSVVSPAGDTSQILWQLDRDPSDPSQQRPQLSASAGPQVSFQPGVAGNFLLTAYADSNNNQQFDIGEQFFIVRFAIVQVTLLGSDNFRTGALILGTGLADAPVSGMSLNAVYRLQGGGAGQTVGTESIVLGNIGNLMSDTFHVDYPPTAQNNTSGSGFDRPSGIPPLLDSGVAPRTGGAPPFRSKSVSASVSASGPGAAVRVSSGDSPQFSWSDPHPATGNPAGMVNGGISFREFIIACSSYFPNTYVPVYQSDWTASPCMSMVTAITPAVAVSSSQPPVLKGGFSSSMVYVPPGGPQNNLGKCAASASVAPSNPLADFALGQAVGDSLAHNSSVIFGELSGAVPVPGRLVEVRVIRSIRGTLREGSTIGIPYARLGASPWSGDALAHAWDHMRFSPRAPLLALLTGTAKGDLRPGDPVLVTSRRRDFDIILFLIGEADRIAESEETLHAAVASAIENRNSALGGYLVARIWHREALANTRVSSSLMASLIGSPAAPAEAWREMAEDIALTYPLLPPSSQSSVIGRFAELAQRPDIYAGAAGFRGLGKIARFAPLNGLTRESIGVLAGSYRHLVKSEQMPREMALETSLVIALD